MKLNDDDRLLPKHVESNIQIKVVVKSVHIVDNFY
jgi:hypothetical protein